MIGFCTPLQRPERPKGASLFRGFLELGERNSAQQRRLNLLTEEVLTTARNRRIHQIDNSIAVTPSPWVAPGGGGPNSDRTQSRGESLFRSVGLNSFGPNPTANLVGAKERGHSKPSGSVLGQAEIGSGGVERSAPPE